MSKISIDLKDIEPLSTLLNCFINLLMEVETTEYRNSDGTKLTDTLAYIEAARNIYRISQEEKNETSNR